MCLPGSRPACISCHLTDFNGTANPNHVAAGFPQDCRTCHTAISWTGATFNHNTATRFPLTGAHINSSCAQCHKNNVFAGLSPCVHLLPSGGFQRHDQIRTTSAAGFPQELQPVPFNDELARRDVQSQHGDEVSADRALTSMSLSCAQCHKNNVFAGLSTACISCHLTDFNGTTNPNHVSAGFPQDCSLCHSTTNWQGATFNHNTATKFPLDRALISMSRPCAQCHQKQRVRRALDGVRILRT